MRKKRLDKAVIAVHVETGNLEQFSSLSGACVFLQNLYKSASIESIRKACLGVNVKYKDRYWSLEE